MGKSRQDQITKAEQKFQKKLQFYAKVRDTVAAKAITKPQKKRRCRQKRLKAYDLSSLSEFLPEVTSVNQQAPASEFKLSCKSRRDLILKEKEQMSEVIKHPAFQADPQASIHQHIMSTQAVSDDKPKKKVNKDKLRRQRGKDQRLNLVMKRWIVEYVC